MIFIIKKLLVYVILIECFMTYHTIKLNHGAEFVQIREVDVVQFETTTTKQNETTTKQKWKSLGFYKCTTYCSCDDCSEGYGNMTSTGVRAKEGRTVAVDPKIIPYGSHLLIKGHEYIAEDCGGMIKGEHIDIYYENHNKAEKIGTRYLEVKIKND